MSSIHGMNAKVYANEVDLTTYFNDYTVTTEADTAETTTFGSGDKTYVAGPRDGSASLSGVWDGAAGAVDDTLAPLVGVENSILTLYPGLDTRGNKAKLLGGIETKYETTGSISDAVMVSADFQASGGVGHGVSLHAKAATTGNQSAGSGVSVDTRTTSSVGYMAHQHVFSASGSSPTLDEEIWDSADNSSFAVITGAVFPQITAAGFQRLSSATQTVRRYVAVKRTIGGTGSPTFTHAVAFAKRH